MREYLFFRDDVAVDETPVAFADLIAGSNASAVQIAPGDDARALIPHLDQVTLIDISFPTFRDGRGYSAARILREAGYAGELRASGDVLVDQLLYMRRCGFDSFAPAAPISAAATTTALSHFDAVYQRAADGQVPVWKLRHG